MENKSKLKNTFSITNNNEIKFYEYNLDKPLKFHLGCGKNIFKDYINIDYGNENHKQTLSPNVTGDITTLNVDNNIVDEIRLHHVFEHFDRVTAIAQLIRWSNFLKNGGLLRIEVPDLLSSAKRLSSPYNNDYYEQIIRHLIGDQTNHWGYHRELWTADRLRNRLELLGFEIINTDFISWKIPPYLDNFEMTGRKIKNISMDEKIKIGGDILKESIVGESEISGKLIHWIKQLMNKLYK